MAITSVPIRVNEDLRPSRLLKSIPSYIKRSIVTIVRIFIIYRPFRFFDIIGAMLFGAGFLIGFDFYWFYLSGDGDGHVQSLILAAVLIGIGFQTFLVAFMADLQAANRKLLEDIRFLSLRNEKFNTTESETGNDRLLRRHRPYNEVGRFVWSLPIYVILPHKSSKILRTNCARRTDNEFSVDASAQKY